MAVRREKNTHQSAALLVGRAVRPGRVGGRPDAAEIGSQKPDPAGLVPFYPQERAAGRLGAAAGDQGPLDLDQLDPGRAAGGALGVEGSGS